MARMNSKSKYLAGFTALFCFIAMSCASGQKSASGQRPEEKLLTKADAEARSRMVSDVRYQMSFKVENTQPDFEGNVAILFNIKKFPLERALTIDFDSAQIKALTVNGKPIASPQYNQIFLTLAEADLRVGENRVQVAYQKPYSKGGDGFYRFKDPEDGNVYLYTDFEPFNANKLFPCFDQPDLKATYQLDVHAPAEWVIVSNTRETEIKTLDGARKHWIFPVSQKFSTYVFALHAGPYAQWGGMAGKIPMRLFARKSLAKYVEHQEWLKITAQGLAFYGKYFDYPYPFKKYDQVIVPDFNAGAMENVADVSFAEKFIHRGKPTREERESRAEVILHEMAHMWFGDLVTMKWWNGLWLNESFASYMAALSSSQATEFKEAWKTFYEGMKHWAYWEDQLVTTHPIEADVPSTDQAFANFDGITYGKGASVLKQVAFLIGKDKFQKGVQNYFKKHEYSNAQLTDFMSALEDASHKDLKGWSREWLFSASLNTVQADWSCKEGKVDQFVLRQSAPTDHPAIRSHQTQIGFYKMNGKKLTQTKVLPFSYSAAQNKVDAAIGLPCPDLVYPNAGDEDYVKIKLDAKSLATALNHMNGVGDLLTRSMMMGTLWEMARDGEMSILDYTTVALSLLQNEKDYNISKWVSETLYGHRPTAPSVLSYLPKDTEATQRFHLLFSEKLEKFFWKKLETAQKGTDFQKLWFDSFVRTATTQSAGKLLLQTLEGKVKIPGLQIDQDRRWDVIWALSALNFSEANALREAEVKRDPSEAGLKRALAAQVAQPNLNNKKGWFGKLLDEKADLNFARIKTIMQSMFPRDQIALKDQFREDFYKNLPLTLKTRGAEFADAFSEYLTPALCDGLSSDSLSRFIKKNEQLVPAVLKNLKVARQENERCTRVRQLAAEQIKAGKPQLF